MSRDTAHIAYVQTSDGVRLALHCLGDDDATPVILVHGTFSNHTSWLGTRGTGLARAVADHGWRAVVLDLRGHGQSQRPVPGVRWNFEDWARRDLPAALDGAAIRQRAILIGHSAGGAAIAMALAAHASVRERVAAVVLAATPIPWQQWARGTMAALIGRIAAGRASFPSRALRLGPEDELGPVIEQWMTWNSTGQWLGVDGFDYLAGLVTVRVPIFGLAGAGDRLWAPAAACQGLVERFGSDRRDFRVCGRATGFSRDYGHVDLVASRSAEAEVWPRILDWLDSVHTPRG